MRLLIAATLALLLWATQANAQISGRGPCYWRVMADSTQVSQHLTQHVALNSLLATGDSLPANMALWVWHDCAYSFQPVAPPPSADTTVIVRVDTVAGPGEIVYLPAVEDSLEITHSAIIPKITMQVGQTVQLCAFFRQRNGVVIRDLDVMLECEEQYLSFLSRFEQPPFTQPTEFTNLSDLGTWVPGPSTTVTQEAGGWRVVMPISGGTYLRTSLDLPAGSYRIEVGHAEGTGGQLLVDVVVPRVGDPLVFPFGTGANTEAVITAPGGVVNIEIDNGTGSLDRVFTQVLVHAEL